MNLTDSPACAQPNIIYVPQSRSSAPQQGSRKFDKPVTVKLANGKTHTLNDCTIGGINGYDWTDMQLSYREAGSVLVLASNEGHNPGPDRAVLEREKKPYNFYLVPYSAIDKLTIEPSKERGLRPAKITFRDQKLKPLEAYLDLRLGMWTLSGVEDLGEFGRGNFDESLSFGKIAEIAFPEVPATKIEAKSNVKSTITQVGGMKHYLTDVRVKAGKFEFRKGETRLEIQLDKIARIDILKEAFPGKVCRVRLKSGAEQELEMYDYKFCGKGPEFYEVIETHSIKSIEFETADAEMNGADNRVVTSTASENKQLKRSPDAPPANWPSSNGELAGGLEVRVKNPNAFHVRVGLRAEGKGKDFIVPPDGSSSVRVPAGSYKIYFHYSTDPDGLYEGDSFALTNRGVEIQIVKIVNGNYGIRRVN